MAQGSAKKIAQQNAATLALLRNGFLISQIIHLISFWLFRSNYTRNKVILYLLSTAAAGSIGLTLSRMGQAVYDRTGDLVKAGDDLSQGGLTAYMFDIVYITWAIHVLTALISAKFYLLYLVIPAYAFYKLWIHILQPRFFPSRPSLVQPVAAEKQQADGLSKKQRKLQERYKAGDKRVQARQ